MNLKLKSYINEFWNKYSRENLVFSCDAGTFRGHVEGDRMIFTSDGSSETYTIYKPTTQDVLEGKGNFNRGNSRELVIEAQLCAAFNRGVATEPYNFNNEAAYYRYRVANFYSGFFHNHAIDGYAYEYLDYRLCSETSMANRSDLYKINISLDDLYCIDMDDINIGGIWRDRGRTG